LKSEEAAKLIKIQPKSVKSSAQTLSNSSLFEEGGLTATSPLTTSAQKQLHRHNPYLVHILNVHPPQTPPQQLIVQPFIGSTFNSLPLINRKLGGGGRALQQRRRQTIAAAAAADHCAGTNGGI
jgi:hypothetical protein